LPNLDLILNFGLQGLKGNIGDAIKDIENADFYNYQIGVKLRYPLGNRESKEKFEKENIRKEQILLSLKNLEIKINKEIQDAIRDIKSAKERLIAEKKSVELSFQNLQKEKEKFRLGLSTIFNVLQYEDNYNNAKARELKAIIDYNIAVSNLNKVTGKNILEYK
jgi:outer membrane protein TolC